MFQTGLAEDMDREWVAAAAAAAVGMGMGADDESEEEGSQDDPEGRAHEVGEPCRGDRQRAGAGLTRGWRVRRHRLTNTYTHRLTD